MVIKAREVGEAAVRLLRQRPKVVVPVVAGAVVVIAAAVALLPAGGNGLASSYSCDFGAYTTTLSFTNTGDGQGQGLAGEVTDSQGDQLETFSGGSVTTRPGGGPENNANIDFGDTTSVSDGNLGLVGSDPGDLGVGATLEPDGSLSFGSDGTCTPS